VVRARWKQAHQVLATQRRWHGPDPLDPERITHLPEQAVRPQAPRTTRLGILDRTMAVEFRAEQTIEMEAILTLAPVSQVARDALEDVTMDVERVLDERVLPITDGASASANFETGCIEVDITLVGATMPELYQKVALIVTQLDRYCDINIAVLHPEATNLPAMTVQGSQMRRVAPPQPDAGLVPA
jgi:hypothetical protein